VYVDDQIESHCNSRGLEILGCYAANEQLHENSITRTTQIFADKISSNLSRAIILQVDNMEIRSNQLANFFKVPPLGDSKLIMIIFIIWIY
jgi:hypothetical protein